MIEIKAHKAHPSYGLGGITSPWKPISDEMMKGVQLAAYICRMYGDGDIWSETILSGGEQVRALWWMEYEKRINDSLAKDCAVIV